ncbi:XRE family transcriptional regulator [Megasphaera cerevisiae DSM 20462]|uniref:XRE family transcriptional regulator n=1 Tax=Megasphaera cerevisiae DSM 20462 TaxID=1122219 RepID=A0A0J6ZQH4_9FIRM|nr:helix-turn-helix transcriptional regulator [Megasphaera cerevisiae]KMO87206.1 XRE family transcriptional regulator [Megasphaera cerevisiae DSM 20462]MCI1750892.1 helix-turn-helix domain-containing protein [Megasphaera cerevisiae]SJZ60625.1 DNA-binding transcriptional regulator, XRE-family HTH domain [Megasphaera cerevisiae DSM 20462]
MFERLKDLRRKKGLTCEQMAELMGLETKGGYNKKELGQTKFTLAEAKKVSDILGYTIENIFYANEVSLKDTKIKY